MSYLTQLANLARALCHPHALRLLLFCNGRGTPFYLPIATVTVALNAFTNSVPEPTIYNVQTEADWCLSELVRFVVEFEDSHEQYLLSLMIIMHGSGPHLLLVMPRCAQSESRAK